MIRDKKSMATYRGEEYLTTSQVAEMKGTTRSVVTNAIREGKIPAMLVNRKEVAGIESVGRTVVYLVRPEDVRDYRPNLKRIHCTMPEADLDDDEYVFLRDAAEMCNMHVTTMIKLTKQRIVGDMKMMMNEKTGKNQICVRFGDLREFIAEYLRTGKLPKEEKCEPVKPVQKREPGPRDLYYDRPLRLARHIIHQAALDLAEGYMEGDTNLIYDCESFFMGRWYGRISFGTDGATMIRMIRERCEKTGWI